MMKGLVLALLLLSVLFLVLGMVSWSPVAAALSAASSLLLLVVAVVAES